LIVKYTENGWEIITQRAHGLLAGQICARWKISEQPARWVETLMATAEHDDVFNEFQPGSLLTGSGGPVNFKMTKFDRAACDQLIDMALSKSRFTALLFARHIGFTHGKEPEAKPYLITLKKCEDKWIKEAGVSISEVDQSYELLEFCDAFSLLVCQDQIPPEERTLEISSGPDGTPYRFFQKDGKLIVSPWPFETKKFEVNYECLHLKQMSYKNDGEFRAALRKAKVELKKITISEQ
jgi:hypothetical protein